jgi:acetyl-CoA synthetase
LEVVAVADVTLENLMSEDRVFPPSDEFVAAANAGPDIYEEAADSEAWWMKQALERITWYQEPTIGLNSDDAPFYKWFEDGKLNLSYNCLDRHLDTIGDKIAYHWIGEPGDTRDITYSELHKEVSKFANALKRGSAPSTRCASAASLRTHSPTEFRTARPRSS